MVYWKLGVGQVKLEIPIRCLRGKIGQEGICMNPESRAGH